MTSTILNGKMVEFHCRAGDPDVDFGGRWRQPCAQLYSAHLHTLVTVIGKLEFCDVHMDELIAAGLIDKPYISEAEAIRDARMELAFLQDRHGRRH